MTWGVSWGAASPPRLSRMTRVPPQGASRWRTRSGSGAKDRTTSVCLCRRSPQASVPLPPAPFTSPKPPGVAVQSPWVAAHGGQEGPPSGTIDRRLDGARPLCTPSALCLPAYNPPPPPGAHIAPPAAAAACAPSTPPVSNRAQKASCTMVSAVWNCWILLHVQTGTRMCRALC